jgi:hypothetical protein
VLKQSNSADKKGSNMNNLEFLKLEQEGIANAINLKTSQLKEQFYLGLSKNPQKVETLLKEKNQLLNAEVKVQKKILKLKKVGK